MKTLPLLILLSAPALFAAPAYRLAEWGTFTSVSGSDGKLLEGVENDVEPLPWFVHSHEGMSSANNRPNPLSFSKGLGLRPLKGVTVKMETPVIYFYSDEKFDAEVSVGFKGGSISQWYPTRSGGETVPFRGLKPAAQGQVPAVQKFADGAMDFTQPFDGSVSWRVSVEPLTADWPARVYHHGETPVWIYPRLPASSLLRTADGQAEKYLFYRGVGRFDAPLSAVFTNDSAFRIANSGPDPIPSLMLYELTREGSVRWKTLQPLAAGVSHSESLAWAAPTPAEQSRLEVHEAMAKMLMENGLERAEADAMILTWHSSYFATPGLRLFWVCPRAYTDKILPLAVTPTPAKIDRVILGRLELLSPAWERELVAKAIESETAEPKRAHPYSWERHWPAYAQRLAQIRPAAAPASQTLPIVIPFRLPE